MTRRRSRQQSTGMGPVMVTMVLGLIAVIALSWDSLPRSTSVPPTQRSTATIRPTPSNTSEDFIKFDGLPRENAEGVVEIAIVVTGSAFERNISVWVEFGGREWIICDSPSTTARLQCYFDPKGKDIPNGAILQVHVQMFNWMNGDPIARLLSGVVWNPDPQ